MIAYTWEPVEYLLDHGLHELGRKFYEKYGDRRFNYDPDWERYKKMQDENILRFMSVRQDNKLIGFASVIIMPNLHDRTLSCAIIQDFYVSPQKGLAHPEIKLFWILEEQLKLMNVKNMTTAQILHGDAKPEFYEFLGFDPTETIWVKSIGGRA